MHKGACLCGTVSYEIDGPFETMLHCHCSMCRKHHGSAFATFAGAPLSSFRWVAGEHAISRHASSPGNQRSFCSTCGSVTPILLPEMQLALCPAGNLEDDPGIAPHAHLFVGSKAPWHTITDALPQYEAWPPHIQAPTVARPAVEPREGITEGSCLCGDVAYEYEGAALRMLHCHCTRCRRGRSAAHATNLGVAVDRFRWIRGEAQVQVYKVPEARFFAVAFCTRCGAETPRISTERGLAVVPAGSLDTDPGIRPTAHIFVGSKASWFPITDDLPQFSEMMPL